MALANQEKVTIALEGDEAGLKRALMEGMKSFLGFTDKVEEGEKSLKKMEGQTDKTGAALKDVTAKARQATGEISALDASVKKTSSDMEKGGAAANRFSMNMAAVATNAERAERALKNANRAAASGGQRVPNWAMPSGGGGGIDKAMLSQQNEMLFQARESVAQIQRVITSGTTGGSRASGGARPPIAPPVGGLMGGGGGGGRAGGGGGALAGGILQAASLSSGGIGQFAGLAGSVSGLIAPLAAAAVGFMALTGAISFTSSAVQKAANMQTLYTSFKVLTGSAATAQKTLEGLVAFAAETPFEMPELAESARMLLAYGFNARDVQKELRMLGDVSSGTGQRIQEIAYLYGTARVQGRLFQVDINQFTNRGIPIIAELAKVLGVAESEVKALTEAGKVGFPEVQQAFQNMTGEGGRFSGMMIEQSKTWNGLMSTLSDNIGIVMTEFGKPIVDNLTPALADAVEQILTLGPLMGDVGNMAVTMGTNFSIVAGAIWDMVEAANQFSPAAIVMGKWWDSSKVRANTQRGQSQSQNDLDDIKDVSSESERARLEKKLNDRLDNVKKKQSEAGNSDAMNESLSVERQNIENNIRSLKNLTKEYILANAARAGARDAANRQAAEDARQEKKDRKEAEAEGKSLTSRREKVIGQSKKTMDRIDIKEAETTEEKKAEAFRQAGDAAGGKKFSSTEDIDAEIERLTKANANGNASTTGAELDTLEKLLEIRKQIAQVEASAAKEEERKKKEQAETVASVQRQTELLAAQATGNKELIKAAEDKAKLEEMTARFIKQGFDPATAGKMAGDVVTGERAKADFEDNKTKGNALRDVNNRAQLLAAELSGDPRKLEAVKFAQRSEEVSRGLQDSGVSKAEADAKGKEMAGLEMLADRNRKDADGIAEGDSMRGIGGGGKAFGGDSTISELTTQTGLLEALVANTSPTGPGGLPGGPTFGALPVGGVPGLGDVTTPVVGSRTPDGGQSGNLAVWGEMLTCLKEIAANTRNLGRGGGGNTLTVEVL